MEKATVQKIYSGEISELNVSTAQAAALLGLSPQWIRQMAKDGWVTQLNRGKWNLAELLAGREKQRNDAERQTSKSASASRVTDARTRQIELSIQQKEGKLISLEEVEGLFDYITGQYLTELSGIPASITRQVRERKRIETIIDQKKKRLTEVFRKAKGDIIPASKPDGAVGADGTRRVGGNK